MERPRILVIDDAEPVRIVLERMLGQAGVPAEAIRLAATASDARREFGEFAPDLVLLDVNLEEPGAPVAVPRESEGARTTPAGVHLAREFLAARPRLKVVICSGLPEEDPILRELVSAGAFGLLPKPVRLARLKELLRLVEEEELNLDRMR